MIERHVRRFSANTVIFAFSLILVLFVFEAAGRFIYPQVLVGDIYFVIQRDFDAYRHVPGTGGEHQAFEFSYSIKINSDGYRDTVLLAEMGPNDIVFVGDSTTFGYGVELEASFTKIVPALLTKRLGFEVKGLNTGMPGTAVPSYIGGYRSNLAAVPHSVAVLGFFTANDVLHPPATDAVERVLGSEVLAAPTNEDPESFSRVARYKVLSFLSRNSVTYGMLRTVKNTDNLLTRALWRMGNGRDPYLFGRTDVSLLEPDTLAFNCFFLAKFGEFVQAAGHQPLIVLIPSREQVEPIPNLEGRPEWNNVSPNQQLANCINEQGHAALDLTGVLRDHYARQNEQLYYTYDGHWNEAGNRVAAEAIARAALEIYSRL